MAKSSFLLWISEAEKHDNHIIGDKGVALGEMCRAGLPIPDGFIVTLNAYSQFLRENKLTVKIQQMLSTLSFEHIDSLKQVSGHIRRMIIRGELSEDFIKEIAKAYRKLGGVFKDAEVTVHPSSLHKGSLVGDQEPFTRVKGETNLILKIKEEWASLFDPGAMKYRHEHKLDHFATSVVVIVQKMVRTDESGIMFTMDSKIHDKAKIIIKDTKGNHYEVDKHDLKIIHATKEKGLTSEQVIQLAELGKKVEHHYYFPQEIKWTLEKGKIFILQTKPLTLIATPSEKLHLFLTGEGVSPGLRSGAVKVISSPADLETFEHGEILVAEKTNYEYISAIKKAAALITDEGGSTSYSAVASREIGLPAVVGVHNATKELRSGTIVTVNGTTGQVHKGAVHLRSITTASTKTATKVYALLEQDHAYDTVSGLEADGVGILSAESLRKKNGKNQSSEQLAKEIVVCCKAFSGLPVIYKMSDFGINNLPGYLYDPRLFESQIEAIKLARDIYGIRNVWLMLPLVRTTKDLIQIKHILSSKGLHRSPSFQLWMLARTPTNVLQLDKLIQVGLDGIAIDMEVLSMLMLGVDWANIDLVSEYEELHPSVVWAMESIIKTAHAHNVNSSINLQSLSVPPVFLEKLVAAGISAVCVTPENLGEVKERISYIERKLLSRRYVKD